MKIESLVKITEFPVKVNQIIFTKKTRLWCKLKYPGHKNGCPNYNKSPFCPPQSPYLEGKLNKFINLKLIIAQFDFESYKQSMGKLHPHWTEKQKGNLLYWQSQIKKRLKIYIKKLSPDLILGNGHGIGSYSMEATGIYVLKTLWNLGIKIELKPKTIVKLVCLIGFKSQKLTNFF